MMRRRAWLLLSIFLGAVPCTPLVFGDDAEAWKQQFHEVLERPEYRPSHWGILVCDAATGDVILEQNADKLFAPASVTKLFSVAAAWETFGPDHRFVTPVYRRGLVDGDGRLDGDVILVAGGDLSLGGRTTAQGEIAFRNGDHTYANGNSTAQLTAEEPLAGLNELASAIASAGIRRIEGDILVDSRLFESASSTGSGPDRVAPFQINDNVLDFVIQPGADGQPATVTWRPETSLFDVDALVDTVGADEKPQIELSWATRGRAVVRGRIPADRAPLVKVLEWPDPDSVARGLFIEALRRAGITTKASPLTPASRESLPSADWYATAPRIASLESPAFSEEAKLILKVSHNLHASTLPLLLAVRHGKRTLSDGLAIEGEVLSKLGVDRTSISFGGGAGGDRADFVTPRATVALLRTMFGRPDFDRFRAALPVLGVDGTLATVVPPDSPARGRVSAKTGTLYWDDNLNRRTLLTSKALAGYIDGQSGRRLAFAIFVNLAHLPSPDETVREGKALGRLAEILQQSL